MPDLRPSFPDIKKTIIKLFIVGGVITAICYLAYLIRWAIHLIW